MYVSHWARIFWSLAIRRGEFLVVIGGVGLGPTHGNVIACQLHSRMRPWPKGAVAIDFNTVVDGIAKTTADRYFVVAWQQI